LGEIGGNSHGAGKKAKAVPSTRCIMKRPSPLMASMKCETFCGSHKKQLVNKSKIW
jgi:hypothetical protein